jgi:hypothetical protein
MTITTDELELALIEDLLKFEFDFPEDRTLNLMVEGIHLGMKPNPEITIDHEIIHDIAVYLIEVEEFGEEVPMEDALKIARFTYGFVMQWTPHRRK